MRSFDRNGEKITEAEQQVKQLSDLYRNHKVSQEEFEKRYSAITAKDITGKRAYDRIPKDLKEGFEGPHNDILRSKTESDIKASIERYANNVKSYDFKNRLAFDQGYKDIVSRPEYKRAPEGLRKQFEDLYKYGPKNLNLQDTEKRVRAMSQLLKQFPNDPAIQSSFEIFYDSVAKTPAYERIPDDVKRIFQKQHQDIEISQKQHAEKQTGLARETYNRLLSQTLAQPRQGLVASV